MTRRLCIREGSESEMTVSPPGSQFFALREREESVREKEKSPRAPTIFHLMVKPAERDCEHRKEMFALPYVIII